MGGRIFALVRSFLIGAAFVSIWTWFLPRWIAAEKGISLSPEVSPAAGILLLIGAAIVLRCFWDFGWSGRGTPAPFDPPRRLVVRGLYRWVRNPMYVGMGIIMIGIALVHAAIRRELLIALAALWAAVSLLVVAYEEPTLQRTFGADYVEYTAHVRRWIPRLRPFDKGSDAAVTSPGLE